MIFCLSLVQMSTGAWGQSAQAQTAKVAVEAKQGALALKNDKPQLAVKNLTKALKKGDVQTFLKAAILNDRGVAYGQLGKFERAIADFNAALKIYPSYGAVYVNRGQLLSINGFYSDAIKDYSSAIALLPNNGEPYVNRGMAYVRDGQYDRAMADFKRASSKLEKSAVPFVGMAVMQLRQGHVFMPLRYAQRALELEPKHPLALYYRAYIAQRAKQYNSATDYYRRAYLAAPQNERLAMAYGLNLESRLWAKTAYGVYSQLLVRTPKHKAALLAHCRVALMLMRYKTCQKDLDLYRETYDEDSDYLVLKALLRLHQGKKNESVEIANGIRPQRFKQDSSILSFAQLKDKLGQKEDAVRLYRKALAHQLVEPQARAHLKRLKAPVALFQVGAKPSGLSGWRFFKDKDGVYYSNWAKLPKLKIPLETFGNGVPTLSDWTLLSGAYKGFGLLRYHFNQAKPSGTYDYVVLIDVKRQEVRAIEPYLVNDKQTDWTWKGDQVLVTDLDGVTHKILLRKRRVIPVNDEVRPVVTKKPLPKPSKEKKTFKSLFDLFGL